MYDHCCEEMTRHLEDGEVDIKFNRVFREYGIGIIGESGTKQIINCCPWCGCKLPTPLRHTWFDILEKMFTDPEFDGIDDPRIPEEFNSDEWWVSRGL